MKGNSPIEQKTDAELQLHMKKKVEGPGSATWRKLIKKEVEKRKTKNEEVEQIDELSKTTLKSYVKRSANSAAANAYIAGGGTGQTDKDQNKKDFRTAVKRIKGIEKATDRLTKEDVEQIEEISNKTKLSYLNVASAKAGGARAMADLHRDAGDEENAKRYDDKAAKREKGISRAVAPVKKHFGMKEEVEQIEEPQIDQEVDTLDESINKYANFLARTKQ
jgi:hypothetical protein